MKRLWAPWRKKYVLHKKPKGCFLCRALRAPRKTDKRNFVLHRSRHGFLILNRYPYGNGHLMISPNRHVSTLEKLGTEERLDILKLLDRALAALRKSFRPQGFNIGANLGYVGGAGVPGHIHIHVVPRWVGDTNFMPLLTGTKVISESLEEAYETLHRHLKK